VRSTQGAARAPVVLDASAMTAWDTDDNGTGQGLPAHADLRGFLRYLVTGKLPGRPATARRPLFSRRFRTQSD